MAILGSFCLGGFVLTMVLGYETKGKSLDEIQKIEKQMNAAEISLLYVQEDIKRLAGDLKRVEGALHTALQEIRRFHS